MTLCQVYYMDIISYTGSVRSIIIISEYIQMIQFSNGNLCDIRYQVVWNTLRIFTDQSAFMSADWVKVTVRICSSMPLVRP